MNQDITFSSYKSIQPNLGKILTKKYLNTKYSKKKALKLNTRYFLEGDIKIQILLLEILFQVRNTFLKLVFQNLFMWCMKHCGVRAYSGIKIFVTEQFYFKNMWIHITSTLRLIVSRSRTSHLL